MLTVPISNQPATPCEMDRCIRERGGSGGGGEKKINKGKINAGKIGTDSISRAFIAFLDGGHNYTKKKLRNVRIKFPNLFLQDFNLSSQQVDLLVNLCFTH